MAKQTKIEILKNGLEIAGLEKSLIQYIMNLCDTPHKQQKMIHFIASTTLDQQKLTEHDWMVRAKSL